MAFTRYYGACSNNLLAVEKIMRLPALPRFVLAIEDELKIKLALKYQTGRRERCEGQEMKWRIKTSFSLSHLLSPKKILS